MCRDTCLRKNGVYSLAHVFPAPLVPRATLEFRFVRDCNDEQLFIAFRHVNVFELSNTRFCISGLKGLEHATLGTVISALNQANCS